MDPAWNPHAPHGAWWGDVLRAAARAPHIDRALPRELRAAAAREEPPPRPVVHHAVAVVDTAWRSRRRADPITVLQWWHALASGKLTVVEEFDAEGRRYLVTHAGPLELPRLARRERRAVMLASRGLSNKVIAAEMRVALSTVATLLRRAAVKLGLNSRVEMVRLLARRSWVEPPVTPAGADPD